MQNCLLFVYALYLINFSELFCVGVTLSINLNHCSGKSRNKILRSNKLTSIIASENIIILQFYQYTNNEPLSPRSGTMQPSVDENESLESRLNGLRNRLFALRGVLPAIMKAKLRCVLEDIHRSSSVDYDTDSSDWSDDDSLDQPTGQTILPAS